MRIRRRSPLSSVWPFLFCGLLVGCGYQCRSSGEGVLLPLSIPVISIDEEGSLRNALVRQLSFNKSFSYSSVPSRYQLLVEVLQDKIDPVGYVWNRNPTKKKKEERLCPSEERRSVQVKARVLDTETGKELMKPFIVSSQSYFDFVHPTVWENIEFVDRQDKKQSVLQFSEGQLDVEEAAKAASFQAIASALAAKIVARLEL